MQRAQQKGHAGHVRGRAGHGTGQHASQGSHASHYSHSPNLNFDTKGGSGRGGGSVDDVQHHIHKVNPQEINPHPSIISCPACGTRHYDYAHFCMKCGGKIKR